MNQMSSVKRATVTAVCIAFCCILPVLFHSIGLGTVFSPIHIPVLLCGLVCGGGYGLVCGLVGPVLSSVITAMPGTMGLITMVPELMVYGLTAGLVMGRIRTGKLYGDLYIALAAAMVLGRVAGGIASALFYLGSGKAFSFGLWVSGYFVGTAPGIICHLIVIPILVVTLMKAKLIPIRYHKE